LVTTGPPVFPWAKRPNFLAPLSAPASGFRLATPASSFNQSLPLPDPPQTTVSSRILTHTPTTVILPLSPATPTSPALFLLSLNAAADSLHDLFSPPPSPPRVPHPPPPPSLLTRHLFFILLLILRYAPPQVFSPSGRLQVTPARPIFFFFCAKNKALPASFLLLL